MPSLPLPLPVTNGSGMLRGRLAAIEATTPERLCAPAVHAAEQAAAIPEQLMAAIARVESGRPDAQGVVRPWPWTINAEGNGQYFATKAEAVAAVRALQARGVRSIDVGCMQVNLFHHPDAFATLDLAFDPATNAAYAARFLRELLAQTGSWARATAAYHSFTPELGEDYRRRVAAAWPEEQRRAHLAEAAAPGAGGNVWTVNAFTTNAWNTHTNPALEGSGQPIHPGTGQPVGGSLLAVGAPPARILPLAQNSAGGVTGRGLEAYRAAPVPLAARPLPRMPL
jgi:hypothetical protein